MFGEDVTSCQPLPNTQQCQQREKVKKTNNFEKLSKQDNHEQQNRVLTPIMIKAFDFVPSEEMSVSGSPTATEPGSVIWAPPPTPSWRSDALKVPTVYGYPQEVEHMPKQKLISTEFALRIKDARQAYLKDVVNCQVRSRKSGYPRIAKFSRGRVLPRQVFLRRTLNAEVKQLGLKRKVNRSITEFGRAMFLKRSAVEEIKQITRKYKVGIEVMEKYKADLERKKMLDSIKARQVVVKYLERQGLRLDTEDAEFILKMVSKEPLYMLAKKICLAECMDEVRLRDEVEKREALTRPSLKDQLKHHFLIREINKEIKRIGREQARDIYINHLLVAKSQKERVVQEIREKALKKKLQELQQKRGRVILQIADIANAERKNDMITSRLETQLKKALQADLTQSLTAEYKRDSEKVIHEQKPSRVPRSESVVNWFRQFYDQRKAVWCPNDNYPGTDRHMKREVVESPGAKEFFMRTLLNNILTKRSNKPARTRKMFLLARHIAMPEQAYLKLKVNEVIKSIGYVKDRQRIRAIKRQINLEIRTHGRKAAVTREIMERSDEIQYRYGLTTEIGRLSLTFDQEMKTPLAVKIAQNKHAKLVNQVQIESRQRQLKKKVVMDIKFAGFKCRVNQEIRELAMAKKLNELRFRRGKIILQLSGMPEQKSAVYKEMRNRQQQSELKKQVIQVIETRGRKLKVMTELRQWALKRRLAKLAGADYRWRQPSRSSNVDRILRRVRQRLIESARVRENTRKMALCIRQYGKARRLKAEVNTIIKTHQRMTQVVLDIKTRGATIRRKAEVVAEIKTRGRTVRLKDQVLLEIKTRGQTIQYKEAVLAQLKRRSRSIRRKYVERHVPWRMQRARLHEDLRKYFKAKRQERERELIRLYPIRRYRNMPVARQMFLKMEMNSEIRQRGRKAVVQRELLLRFRTVDLKNRLCEEILERARKQVWRKDVQCCITQRALKAKLIREVEEGRWNLRHVEASEEVEEEVLFEFDNIVLTDKYSQIKRTRELKRAVNNEIEKMQLRKRLQQCRKRRGPIILALAQVDNKQIAFKKKLMKEVRDKYIEKYMLKVLEDRARARNRMQKIEQVLKQRELKTRVNREIIQARKQYLCKKQMLGELRMIKLKMLVGREIKKIGEIKRNYRAVVQDIQARGDKARVVIQIKNKQHWMLDVKGKKIRAAQAKLYSRVVEQITIMGRRVRVIEELRWREENARRRKQIKVILAQRKRKEACLREMERAKRKTTVKKMLLIRANVIRLKARLCMELKVRVAKARCVRAIWEKAEARRNHVLVCEELKQRSRLANCVHAIKRGKLELRSVAEPVDISSLAIVKQQLLKKQVNTVIKQAGRKIELNKEIVERQAQCNRKALVTSELVYRFLKTKLCKEIRSKGRSVLQGESRLRKKVAVYHEMVITELKTRINHLEVVKEIKTRQKQIFWKKQTCIIIKQGGFKVRVNKQIRSMAKQKYMKKEINTIIKQGGLKSDVLKSIRQLRLIADLKKQRDLKAHVVLSIKQIGKAYEDKRRVCVVIKQTGLKARCNREIRKKQYRLRSLFMPRLTSKEFAQRIINHSNEGRRALNINPRSEALPTKFTRDLPPPIYRQKSDGVRNDYQPVTNPWRRRQQVRSQSHFPSLKDIAHPELGRPRIGAARRRRQQREPKRFDYFKEREDARMEESKLHERGEGEERDVTIIWPSTTVGSDRALQFDDLDSVYGESVSEKGIAIMKLVDSVMKESKIRKEQDIKIRELNVEIVQQRKDFKALTERVVDDKNNLYQELEKLKLENESLTFELEKQEKEEKLIAMRKAQARLAKKAKRKRNQSQRQQIPVFYQEMQEFGKGKAIHQGTPTQEATRMTELLF